MSAVSTTNTLRKETVEIKADFTRQAGIIQGMWLHQKPYLLYFVFGVTGALLSFYSTRKHGRLLPLSASTYVSSLATDKVRSAENTTHTSLYTHQARDGICFVKEDTFFHKNPVPSLLVNTIFVVVCFTEHVRINVDSIIHKLN